METIFFDYNLNNACVGKNKFIEIRNRLLPEIKRIQTARKNFYSTDYASVNVPFDIQNLQDVKALIALKKRLSPTAIVVVGIGGSNLGTIAVHKAINGVLYNEQDPKVKVYFADTVDADYISDIVEILERELQRGSNILLNVVTKSGTTTETMANFEVFLELLKAYKKSSYRDYIIITTDKGSKLCEYANENHITCLEIPKKVGGRYSVFSPVGLFPLGFLGIDLEKLLAGAMDMVLQCTSEHLDENIAVNTASIAYYHYKNGANINDTFIFSRDFYSIGLWYRQLVGESLGKRYNKEGRIVEVGITPTVSLGTTDLHSVAQLYFGGPRDKFTTFITVEPRKNVFLPKIDAFEKFVANIQGKSISFIMSSIAQGVKKAYQKDARPFVSLHVPQANEFFVGQILQWKMLEIIYLGYLFDVNPFDQPQVDLYKKETRKVLAQ